MPAIPKGYQANFRALCRAVEADDACLVDAQEKATGKSVVLVCALNQSEGQYQFVPMAVMIDGNPYELYNPPKDGGGYDTTQGQ